MLRKLDPDDTDLDFDDSRAQAAGDSFEQMPTNYLDEQILSKNQWFAKAKHHQDRYLLVVHLLSCEL